MRYQSIGRLAEKNHATIIHAEKAVDSFLSIRDNEVINTLNLWVSVFDEMFGASELTAQNLRENIRSTINDTALTNEDVYKLLISMSKEYCD